MLSLSATQRRELRSIADEAPPAIRRRLRLLLVELGQGQARTLDAFMDGVAA